MECDYAVTIPGHRRRRRDDHRRPAALRDARHRRGRRLQARRRRQFDEDDVRLLEVLGGHASVALENARLYEAERLEAKRARASLEISNALLDFSRRLALAESLDEVLAAGASTWPPGSWRSRARQSGCRIAPARISPPARSTASNRVTRPS